MSNYFKEGEQSSFTQKQELTKLQRLINYYNAIRDKIIIYAPERWGIIAILALFYFIRLVFTGGYFALTYCIGIHFLNSFIGFISPLEDPEEAEGEDDSFLPQKNSEEFIPFQRKVKEFQFWEVMFWTLLVGIFLTFFEAFDIPVFWPLLLFYFILIFLLTMRKQIQHMIKYNYLPWDAGKVNYTPKK